MPLFGNKLKLVELEVFLLQPKNMLLNYKLQFANIKDLLVELADFHLLPKNML